MTLRLPRHLANEADGPGESPAVRPDVDGIDLASVRMAAMARGADAQRFDARLAAGLELVFGAPEPGGTAGGLAAAAAVSLADLVGISAWRAGALPLRDDALLRIERMVDAGATHVVAAILGLDSDEVARFVDHQRTDRWWWPGRDDMRGYVAAVGGFVGLGGEWTEPPSEAWPLGEDGSFAILTGGTWWRLDADVWGNRLVALAEPPARSSYAPVMVTPGAPLGAVKVLATHSWKVGVSVSLLLPQSTFLAWLWVETS